MSESLVGNAFAAAHRAVLFALLACAALISLLLVERWIYGAAFEDAAAAAKRTYEIAGQVLLEDERLTMSANMAAATGESRWRERYDQRVPQIDEAIAAGLALATPEAGQRFEEATKHANDRLVEMEREALGRAEAGDLAGARAILDGPAYLAQKRILASGTDRFIADLRASAAQRIEQVRLNAFWALVAVLIGGAFVFTWLWRALTRTLTASQAACRHAEERLRVMATTDDLTNLPNRRSFTERLTKLFAERDRHGRGVVAVAMIDLDHFKDINDTLGHQAGDELIREVVRRLGEHVPSEAVLARLGGDELAIALPASEMSVARAQLATMTGAFLKPLAIGAHTLHVTASIGVATYPADAGQPQEIMRLADIALYRAKADGRGRMRLFEPEMDAQVQSRKELESDLRAALASGQVFLQYQPLVSRDGATVTGVEALMRWRHPVKGLISPGLFIPVAEQSGLIQELGAWAMEQAFRDARRWSGLTVAINLSPIQFKQAGFLAAVKRLVARTGVDPYQIEFEVTETLLLEDTDRVQRALDQLKAMGFRIALDDFGTGYSSLNYLRRFPFDKIKIDQTYIQSIETSQEAAQIIHSVVGLGRALHMTVTAEGVETGAQHRFLQAAGCHQLQGFLFSRPMDAGDLERLLAAGTRAADGTVAAA